MSVQALLRLAPTRRAERDPSPRSRASAYSGLAARDHAIRLAALLRRMRVSYGPDGAPVLRIEGLAQAADAIPNAAEMALARGHAAGLMLCWQEEVWTALANAADMLDDDARLADEGASARLADLFDAAFPDLARGDAQAVETACRAIGDALAQALAPARERHGRQAILAPLLAMVQRLSNAPDHAKPAPLAPVFRTERSSRS